MNKKSNINEHSNISLQELQASARTILQRSEDLKKQHSSSTGDGDHRVVPVLYFINELNLEIETLSKHIHERLDNLSLLYTLKNAKFLKQKINLLIRRCALLEMKNMSIKGLSHQLKNDLLKLNRLQVQWFNASCLKN